MPTTMQEFLADATQKASTDLVTAYLRIPENKRDWSPDTKARTALDQMAECILLAGYTAVTIKTKQMAAGSMENFFSEKDKLKTQDWDALNALLQENTAKVSAAIRTVPDSDLEVQISMPWGIMTVGQIITYPSWNLHYHEGQINYIASILGCLD